MARRTAARSFRLTHLLPGGPLHQDDGHMGAHGRACGAAYAPFRPSHLDGPKAVPVEAIGQAEHVLGAELNAESTAPALILSLIHI